MDPLTDTLVEMRIRSATFTRLEATAPWAWASQGDRAVKFVLVVRGSGVLTTVNHPAIHLRRRCFNMLDDERLDVRS